MYCTKGGLIRSLALIPLTRFCLSAVAAATSPPSPSCLSLPLLRPIPSPPSASTIPLVRSWLPSPQSSPLSLSLHFPSSLALRRLLRRHALFVLPASTSPSLSLSVLLPLPLHLPSSISSTIKPSRLYFVVFSSL